MTTKTLGLVAIGSALVDVLSFKDDAFLDAHGLNHGGMVLQNEATSETLYAALGKDTQLCSGGSSANSSVGFAMLGGKAAFIGRVKDDKLGKAFKQSLEDTGTQFVGCTSPSPTSTGRCIVVVTDHGGKTERTMATFLGASCELCMEDISEQTIKRAQILFLEGYSWDSPSVKAAIEYAVKIAKEAGTKVALSLSDPFCVERHKAEFLSFIEKHVDILFANEHEIEAMYGSKDMKEILLKIHNVCDFVAVTFSDKGSFILTEKNIHKIAPFPTKVVDVTGAGDLYAAGVLYGIANGLTPDACGKLGSQCASEVIQHLGGRPKGNLKGLVEKV